MTVAKRAAGLALGLAVIVGLSHLLPTALESSGPAIVVWKGAGVTLLGVYAGILARTVDGWLIAFVMFCGAVGDVLIETTGFIAGAAGFALGHAVAIVLYLRNRRPGIAGGLVVGLGIAVAAAVAIWFAARSAPIAGYAALLVGMAATAWLSRFPRPHTGLGAILFVVSDGIIFLRRGLWSGSIEAAVVTWAAYFLGQLLIVIGVTRTLSRTSARAGSD